MTPNIRESTIAVLGGTGPQGRGLATRWAVAGLNVIVGSRQPEQAQEAALEIASLAGNSGVRGMDNESAAAHCDIAVVVVPWSGHDATIAAIKDHVRGKLVVDCVNPLGFDKQGPYVLPVDAGSATERAAELLPESEVVGAFHNVSAVSLNDLENDVASDVLVLGESRTHTDLVQQLAESIPGVRGIYAGRLRNSAQIEGLTANLISINRRYKTHSSPRISGV